MRAIAISLGVLVLTSGLAAAPPDARVADAAQRRDIDGVRTLLRSGADVNAAQGDGMTALHWASLNADLETMNVLLAAGATTEALTRVGAYTPLHLASGRGHAAAVERLLKAGSRVAALTSTGVQALHLAAQSGSAPTVTALLDAGADAMLETRHTDGQHWSSRPPAIGWTWSQSCSRGGPMPVSRQR